MLNKENFKILNGQKIYFLNKVDWEILFKNGSFSIFELEKNIINLLKNKDYILSKKYKEIFLGLGFVPSGFCLPYTFLKIENEYLRMQIEYKLCPNCNKELIICNSKDSSIYVGVPDYISRLELMKESNKYIKNLCPNCKNEIFDSFVIWSVIK